jgi:hypothetical protein
MDLQQLSARRPSTALQACDELRQVEVRILPPRFSCALPSARSDLTFFTVVIMIAGRFISGR